MNGAENVLVRLGYVALSMVLEDCSSSKTITVKNYERIEGQDARIGRLRRITGENLKNLTRLLYYNTANEVHLFRITSKLVPLATHPLAAGWDFIADFREEFAKIGTIVRENKMRVSSHPDHFTLINSPRQEVIEASFRDLDYHEKVFRAMGLDNAEMVMHVGGMYGSREQSVKRFKENFKELPDRIRKRLLLENDDKLYGAADVLDICGELNIPMVFDVHHHMCCSRGEVLGDILQKVYNTWGERIPKLHFSSPRSEQKCRPHADDIDFDSFYGFLKTAREFNRDIDVMLEAKNKDRALFKLMGQLKETAGIKAAGGASFLI
ncbi:UV DNA damage repair endonuclease UvsE [Phosphitispora sp. TUW77]|uniref:UV DNA damage repair endonuclease UvsE n=1 Tax=Phosphitispora sp. TUW77 TaxID=3152361 RepID=UPI003AB6EA02